MTAQNLSVIIPLVFLGILGLIQLLQQFGYLKPKDQKELQDQTKELYQVVTSTAFESHMRHVEELHNLLASKAGDKPSGFEYLTSKVLAGTTGVSKALQDYQETTISTVTQTADTASEALTSTRQMLSLIESKEFGLRTIQPLARDFKEQKGETKRRFDEFSSDLTALRESMQRITASISEQYERVRGVADVIKKKASAQLMEKTRDMVAEVREVVLNHDRAVKELEKSHPRAAFEKGERPAHWCSASDVSRELSEMMQDVVTYTRETREYTVHLQDALIRLREKENEEMSQDLTNFLKVVELLSSVQGRVETLHTKHEELIRLLEEENGR